MANIIPTYVTMKSLPILLFSVPPVNFKREQEQKATEIDDDGGGVGGDGDDNSGRHCKHQLFQKHEQQPNTG